MKKIILILALAFLFVLPASAVKRIEANPINIAYMLAQDTDSAKIAQTLAYYGYQPQTTHTERSSDTASADTPYSTYRHSNGSIIRYTFKGEGYPYVEVKSNSGARNADAILTNLGFQKSGSHYEQKTGKYSKSQFTCKPGASGTLVFHKTHLAQSSR